MASVDQERCETRRRSSLKFERLRSSKLDERGSSSDVKRWTRPRVPGQPTEVDRSQ
jgi:hypothetical protein